MENLQKSPNVFPPFHDILRKKMFFLKRSLAKLYLILNTHYYSGANFSQKIKICENLFFNETILLYNADLCAVFEELTCKTNKWTDIPYRRYYN